MAAATGGFVINGQGRWDRSGISVSSAGDVNGDGLADLIVGADLSDPAAVSNAGRSYVVFGQTGTTAIDLSAVAAGTGGFVINGQCVDDNSGNSVSNAGDVNGDGLADLIVGAYNSDPDVMSGDAGRGYVVFGQTGTTAINLSALGTGGFVINGQSANDYSGYSVSSAGDVNGDGLADLIVGADLSDPTGGANAGRSYLVFGQTDTTAIDLSAVAAGTGGFVINGQCADDMSGFSVSSAGDVNGDGFADLIVGAANSDIATAYNVGRSYVIFGATSGAFEQTAVDQMGTAGDDTLSDGGTAQTIVAGTGNDSLTATAASVLYGGAGADTFTINSTLLTALKTGYGSGGNANQLARIDGGSGIDTIVLSGSSLNFDLTAIANQAGANPDGGSRLGSIERIDLITGGNTNTLTLAAGDVNDLAGFNTFNSGNGWVGLASSVQRRQLVVDGGEGSSLDIKGSWSRGTTVNNGGQTYRAYESGMAQLLVDTDVTVKFDASVKLSAIAAGVGGFVINGQCAGDQSGISVSSAGDVNGDGLADLIVGANYSDPDALSSDAGRSYVVFGKTSGTAINLAAVAAGTGGFAINGQLTNDNSGSSVSNAGDVNGDGLADLIVGAPNSDPAQVGDAGRSYVVFGKTSGAAINLSAVAAGTGGFAINGQCAGENSGYSVSSAGDMNGDGLADLIIGALRGDPDAVRSAGRSYVVFGQTGTTAINLSDLAAGTGGFVINGQCQWDQSGISVSSAGDVNGDGLADLIVGAKQSDPAAGSDAGRSYVIFGSNSGAFLQSAVDQVGDASANTLTDGGTAQTIVAGAGNDNLTATAASVLYGGAGDDTFTINSTMVTALLASDGNVGQLARIDGGGGLDKIVLSGTNLLFDLTKIEQSAMNPDGGARLGSIEKIDLGAASNVVFLTMKDVMDMSSAVDLVASGAGWSGRRQILITGTVGATEALSSTVDLADGTGTTGWKLETPFLSSTATQRTYDGISYDTWYVNTNMAGQVSVLVQHGLNVI